MRRRDRPPDRPPVGPGAHGRGSHQSARRGWARAGGRSVGAARQRLRRAAHRRAVAGRSRSGRAPCRAAGPRDRYRLRGGRCAGSPHRRARTGSGRGSFDVFAPVAGRRRVWQIPGVELDDDRAAGVDLLGDLQRQRSIRLHFVDVDAEQRLEIGRVRLEERPLVALKVQANERPKRCQRLVATAMEQLDDDVRVAVGLQVGAPRAVDRVGSVGAHVEVEQPAICACRRGAHRSQSCRRTSSGQLAGSSPWVRRRARTIRS